MRNFGKKTFKVIGSGNEFLDTIGKDINKIKILKHAISAKGFSAELHFELHITTINMA
jgi:hypothetical protein